MARHPKKAANQPSAPANGNKRPHSVPVPRIYKVAVQILKQYDNKEGSLKKLLYNAKYPDLKKLYGLLCNVVSNSNRIKLALATSRVLVEQPKFDPKLAEILTAELLRKGKLEGKCTPIVILMQYEEKLKKSFNATTKEESDSKKGVSIPRYVRVNTIYASVARIHKELADEGWKLVGKSFKSYDKFLKAVGRLGESEYMMDYHIEELLVFPPNTAFFDSPLYKTGAIVLQDKASCLPVFLSDVQPGAQVIDACAAPGNKTSYIAAVMKNKGKLLAVEKDAQRFKILETLLKKRGVGCVRCEKKDFSKVSRDKNAAANYIFLDPTCSNSGDPTERVEEVTPQRLQRLASFQVLLLKAALSYPFVKEVMYSTCSIKEEENEMVVSDVLDAFSHDFELADIGSKLGGWKHFGNERYEFGKKCIRTVSEVDKCHGFFVAKFVRKENSKTDEAQNGKQNKRKRGADVDNSEESSSHKRKQKKKLGKRDKEQDDGEEDSAFNVELHHEDVETEEVDAEYSD